MEEVEWRAAQALRTYRLEGNMGEGICSDTCFEFAALIPREVR